MSGYKTYQSNLLQLCAERGFWLRPLGFLDGYITWCVLTHNPKDTDLPKVLITAGIHGEEYAGPLAVLKWLREVDDILLAKANMSFVPVVNCYGFNNKKRYGLSGIPTNGGFGSNRTQDPSPEGQIIINNIGILRPLAEEGFMALHEDVGAVESYLYTMEKSEEPGSFTKSLRRELSKYFPKVYDGVAYVHSGDRSAGPMCRKGVIFNFQDESLEALMFQLGVPRCAVPETPGRRVLHKRIEAHEAMITRFIELCVEEA